MLVFDASDVLVTRGELALHASSPDVTRGFCASCGTTLTWARGDLLSIHIGALDDPEAWPPTLHWQAHDRLDWCDIGRDLPDRDLDESLI